MIHKNVSFLLRRAKITLWSRCRNRDNSLSTNRFTGIFMATVLTLRCGIGWRLQRRLFAQLRTDVDRYDYSIQWYSPRPRIRSELVFTSSKEEEWPVLIERLVRDLNRKRSLRAERSSSGDKGS